MTATLRLWIALCISWLVAATSSLNAAPAGFLEGHLNIIAPKEVELAGETPAQVAAENYAQYPLLVLSKDGKKEVARLIADQHGNYRAALPPGDYVLDVQGRVRGHLRAKPRPFTVASHHTIRVDMAIDTGVR
jgi:hypothetical protein